MIASWRGLVVVAALAVVLVVLVVLDLARAPAAIDRALVPGFDPTGVTELQWEHGGQPAVGVVRVADGWQLRAPARLQADPSTIGEVLAALRGARWHRRGPGAAITTTLTITSGGTRRVLGLGAAVAGTEQAWIVDGERSVLVDRWVVHALDPDPLALRIRTPLLDVARADTITIEEAAAAGRAATGLQLEGTPRRLVRPVALVLAAELAESLERALRDVAIVRLPDSPPAAGDLVVRVARAGTVVTLQLGGPCPGAPALVAMTGSAGDGCVESATATAVIRAVERLQQPAAAIVERRAVPFEPAHVVLSDAAVLDVTLLRIGGHRADPSRVAELLAALAVPAELVARPAAPSSQRLVVTGGNATKITLALFADHVIARDGEPIALRLAPGAWQLLTRPSRELREVAPWLEEPTTITALAIDGVRYERGAVIGAWSRQPPGAADARALEALVGLLAAPRSLGFVDTAITVVHRVTITVTPPAGAPVAHVLELGAPRAAGCPARLADEALVLPAAICTHVAALAR